MKSFAVLSVLASLAAQAIAALTINTPPTLVQCEPSLISWTDGTAPYYLTIIPGGQVSASPLKSFGSTTSTSYTWNTDIASGTSVTLALRDSTGTQVYSDAVTISSSSDSSCVNSSVDESAASASGLSGSASTGATTTGSSATGSSAAGSSTGTVTGTSSTSTSSVSHSTSSSGSSGSSTSIKTTSSSATHSSTSSGSASSSSASSGAMRSSSMNAAGIAGLLGVVGAALL